MYLCVIVNLMITDLEPGNTETPFIGTLKINAGFYSDLHLHIPLTVWVIHVEIWSFLHSEDEFDLNLDTK